MFILSPRRSRGLAAVVTATLASVALTGAAGAAPRRAHATRANTVHVIEHAITDTENPGAAGPDAKGNTLTFINPVFNAANRRRVGHDEGFCTRLDPKQGVWECLWTTFLKRGQITVQGPFYDTRNSVLSITGGTGAYRRARGQMTLVSRDGGKQYDFLFALS